MTIGSQASKERQQSLREAQHVERCISYSYYTFFLFGGEKKEAKKIRRRKS
jgi:hypothetical protein